MFKKLLERWRYRRAIRTIRAEAAALGLSLDHLSDEELEERVAAAARVWARAGVTAADAAAGLTALARAAPGLRIPTPGEGARC